MTLTVSRRMRTKPIGPPLGTDDLLATAGRRSEASVPIARVGAAAWRWRRAVAAVTLSCAVGALGAVGCGHNSGSPGPQAPQKSGGGGW
jgi:hypothetical protein